MTFAFNPGNCSDCCSEPTCNLGYLYYTPDLPHNLNVVYIRWYYAAASVPCSWFNSDGTYYASGSRGAGVYGPKNTANASQWGYWLAFYDSEDGDNLYFKREAGDGGPEVNVTVARKINTSGRVSCTSPATYYELWRIIRIAATDTASGQSFDFYCDGAGTIIKTSNCGDVSKMTFEYDNYYHEQLLPAADLPATVDLTVAGFSSNGVYLCDCEDYGVNGTQTLSLVYSTEEDHWITQCQWSYASNSVVGFQRLKQCSSGGFGPWPLHYAQRYNDLVNPKTCFGAWGWVAPFSSKADRPHEGVPSAFNTVSSKFSPNCPASLFNCGITAVCPVAGTVTVTY